MKKAFKRILSVLLVAVMIIGSAPMSGFAELEWPKWLNFDFLKIKASAEEFNYGDYTYTLDSENNATITGFKKSYSGSLNIPSVIGDSNYKVVAIGDSAFYGCENLTSVTIPDSVTSIGDYAFGGCKRLSNADLGGVEKLGYYIFSGCVSLKSITIPKTVKNARYSYSDYYNGPFADSSIETATIEKGIANIPAFLFSNCTTLKTVTIPEKDDALDEYEIGDYAFYKTGLTKVELPKSATSIGNGTFASCTSLTSVTIQNNVKNIGDSAFYGCENLTGVTIQNNVKNIGDSAFYGCENLTSVTIPDSVTSIGDYAFGGCKRLSNADLGGVEKLGYYIFSGCVSLKSITIPKTVKNARYSYSDYYNGPFADSSIETATIEKGIANIPAFLFSNCTTLKTVTIPEKDDALDEYEIGDYAFYKTGLTKVELPKSATSIGNGTFASCTSLTSVTIQNNVKNIGDSAFYGCENLTGVTIQNNVKNIGDSAFYGCENLTSVTIPDSVTSIGDYAFGGCKRLSNADLGGVEKLGYYIFSGCVSLKSITIPKTVKNARYSYSDYYNGPFADSSIETATIEKGIANIPAFLFSNCTTLKTVTIPEKDDALDEYEIGDYAFYKTGLTKVELPKSATSIGNGTFASCTSLTSVTIQNNVKNIGDSAFYGCENLTGVTIQNNVKNIGDSAFYGCENLTSVTIPDSVTSIGDYAFGGCKRLSNADLGGVEKLGYYIFSGCVSLKSITIPKTVKNARYSYSDYYNGPFADSSIETATIEKGIANIPAFLFSNCTTLKTVTIPEKVTSIGNYAFYGCANLKSLSFSSSVKNIGTNVFLNCPNLVVSTERNSHMSIYCIDNDVLFKFINSNDTLEESLLIERKQSYYNLLTQSVSNGSVTAVVKYKLKDVYVTNKSIIVSLPKNGNYYSDSLKLDDVSITNYKYDSEKNTLTIPITQREGAIKFTVLLPKAEPLQSYAKISYTYQGTEQEEIIGVLTSTYDLLTITAPKKTSSGTIDVSGVAPSKAVVQISISDKIIKEVTASTTGVYKATVQIPDAQNLTAYVVKAQTKAGGRELESSTLVSYTIDDENIDITQFDFHYRNSTTDLLSLNGKRSVISVTDSPMTFIINTTKNEKIKGINVVSEKNGERKKIRAIYDESKNRFIASGYFDDSNHNYLPGTLYVQYEQKDEDVSFTSTPSYTLSEYKELFEKNGISYSDSKISNDEISVKLNVKGKDYTQTLKKEKIYDSVTGTLADLGGEYAKANGFEEFVDANDIKCYAKIVSPYSSDGDKIINVLKIYKNHDSEVISVFFDDDVADAYKYIKDVALKPVFQYGSMITDVIKGAKRENELYDAYWNSDKSDASTTAYNYAYALNGLATIGQVGLGMFLLMGAAVPAAWVAAIGIVCGGMIYTCNEITKGLRGEEAFSLFTRALSFIRFSCDPSGYVFEAVPSNRIEGVKTTVYYKDSKNGKAILWDASEYDQMNPLYTDSQGCYAWDVPEGYWQVKFEKEGYETTYSEWLPVPPPQLDVNVGIVSKAAPTVKLVNIYQDEAEIKFSQYMDISSVTTSNVTFTCGGKTVNGSLKAVDAEKSYDGSVEYATTFSFIPDVKFDGTVTVNVSNVKNYAGKSIAATYKSNRNVVYKLQSVEAPETVNIAYDSVGTITLTAKPALAAKGKKVYFSLNDSYIAALDSSDATFDENGVAKVKVTTLLPGMAELTYNIEGTTCEGKIVINVDFNSNVPVEGISINKDKLELKVGESNTISVAITPEDASNKNIEWSSSNSKVATVNENGVVSAISEGTAEIKAITEDGKFEAVCVVTVKPASVPPVVIESISIKSLPNKTSYYVGDQIDLSGLTLEAKYSDGTTKIIENGFECSPKQLTSVGKKTVTVTYEGKKATFDVSVLEKTTPKPGVKSVSIDDISLNYKKSTTIKPTIKADEGAKYKVEYSTSNAKVATVDKNGKVTATKRGSGTATITCTVTDSNGNVVKDTCKVNVSLTWWQWIITIVLFGWIWY